MTAFLLATDSVHGTAAGCDYLAGQLGPEDSVLALAVVEGEENAETRDVADALNVAAVRLPGTVETERREGEAAATILDVAAEYNVDELVLITSAGSSGVGSTIQAILADADRPVRVVSGA